MGDQRDEGSAVQHSLEGGCSAHLIFNEHTIGLLEIDADLVRDVDVWSLFVAHNLEPQGFRAVLNGMKHGFQDI